jgi:hypothetical protein
MRASANEPTEAKVDTCQSVTRCWAVLPEMALPAGDTDTRLHPAGR